RVAFAAALVPVVIAAEAHDARAPHLRLLAGDALHQLGERAAIGAPRHVFDRRDVVGDARIGYPGLVLGHRCSSAATVRMGIASCSRCTVGIDPGFAGFRPPSLNHTEKTPCLRGGKTSCSSVSPTIATSEDRIFSVARTWDQKSGESLRTPISVKQKTSVMNSRRDTRSSARSIIAWSDTTAFVATARRCVGA